MQQKRSMDKVSRKDWNALVEQTKARTLNQSNSQRNNLHSKRMVSSQSPSLTPTQDRRVQPVTPSPTTIPTATQSQVRRPTQNLPVKPKVNRRKYLKCHKYGCPVNNHHPDFHHIKYHNVLKYPAELKGKNPSKASVTNRQARIFHRCEYLRRMKLDPDCTKDYRICERHKFCEEAHWVKVQFKRENGIKSSS